jgi:hypothetical protein
MNFTEKTRRRAELRREARKLLALIVDTDDTKIRREFAQQAFELVQAAETLHMSEEEMVAGRAIRHRSVRPEVISGPVTRIPQLHQISDAKRARRWRDKSEELRAAAESLKSESARHTLLRLAEDYDALAESLEALREPRAEVPDAG